MKPDERKRGRSLELAHSLFREKTPTAKEVVADAEVFYQFLKGGNANGA